MSDINLIRSIITLIAFICFVVIAVWAWLPRNRQTFDEIGMLPLRDEQGFEAHPGDSK